MTLTVREATAADLPAVQDLCRAYRRLLVARSGHVPRFIEHYYAEADFEALLTELPARHAPPGAIFVAEDAGHPVGCAMTHVVALGTVEIKRVFVAPMARGKGAAEALFAIAMDHAARAGFHRMVLDTFETLNEAQRLYEKMGFSPCGPFYDPDPELAQHIRFFDQPLPSRD